MPNHIHLIIIFNNQPLLSDFMRDFKKYTSRQIRFKIRDDKHLDLLKMLFYNNGEQKFKIWQDRFDSKIILTKDMLLSKINYIHNNPVRKNLVEKDVDWKFSSARFYSGMEDIYIKIKNAAELIY